MSKRPGADLGAMTISKADAGTAVPFRDSQQTTQAPQAAATGGTKGLTVKLSAADYAALRAYCYEQEQARGSRLTHQHVMVQALKEFLDKHHTNRQ